MINNTSFWVVLFQLLKMINGLISVLFVPIFLTSNEQGLWFLILSFGSIILLFSMAQNNMVLIFATHEFKLLKYDNKEILGEENSKRYLFSFVLFSSKFFIYVLFFLDIMVLFIFFIYTYGLTYIVFLNFVFYIIGLTFYATNFLILSYIESFNYISYSYKLRSIFLLIINIIMIIFLYNDFELFSLSLSYLISMIFCFCFLVYNFKDLIKNILYSNLKILNRKKNLFLNYFRKNSFSVVSGFLLFQIYMPLVFYFKGSEYTGKVGLSISIFVALFTISITLLQSKMIVIINLIASKSLKESHTFYFKLVKKSLLIYIIFFSLGLFLLNYVEIFHIYKDRIVDIKSFILLGISWFFQIIVHSLVTYVRLFKRELFIVPTIISIIYILFTTTFILKYMNEDYLFLGFLTSYIFGLPWIYYIYKKFIFQRL